MRKYRRFVGNPKETRAGQGDLGVCNALSGAIFGAAAALQAGLLAGLVSVEQTRPSPIRHAMSHNHGAFLVILSETARQNRHFCRPARLSY